MQPLWKRGVCNVEAQRFCKEAVVHGHQQYIMIRRKVVIHRAVSLQQRLILSRTASCAKIIGLSTLGFHYIPWFQSAFAHAFHISRYRLHLSLLEQHAFSRLYDHSWEVDRYGLLDMGIIDGAVSASPSRGHALWRGPQRCLKTFATHAEKWSRFFHLP